MRLRTVLRAPDLSWRTPVWVDGLSPSSLPIADGREPPIVAAVVAELCWCWKGDLGVVLPAPDSHVGNREKLSKLSAPYISRAALTRGGVLVSARGTGPNC